MNLNLYAISSLIAFLTCTVLGIFTYLQGPKKILKRSFSFVSILIGLWCLFPFLTYIAPTDKKALLYGRMVYIAAVFTPSAFFHFVFVMLEINERKLEKNIIRIFYIISFLFLFILFNPNFIKGIIRRAPYSAVIPGPLYPLFILFFGILCPYAIYQLFIAVKNKKGYKKNQLEYLCIGFFIALIGGILHLAAGYIHMEPFPHDILLIVWTAIISYAIIKYHLMDINIVIKKSTLFAWRVLFPVLLFILFVSFGQPVFIKYLPLWLWWLTVAIFGCIMAYYLYNKTIQILKLKDEELEKEKYTYREKLRAYTQDITRSKSFEEAATYIVRKVSLIGRIDFCAIARLKEVFEGEKQKINLQLDFHH